MYPYMTLRTYKEKEEERSKRKSKKEKQNKLTTDKRIIGRNTARHKTNKNGSSLNRTLGIQHDTHTLEASFAEVQAILERDGKELVLMQHKAHGLILEGLLLL